MPGSPDPSGVATVTVRVAGGSYPVHLGRGLLDRAGELVAGLLPGATAAAVVHPAPLARPAGQVAQALQRQGLAAHLLQVPDGEAAKRLPVIEGLYRAFAAIPTHRADPVVAVGGGATTDAAGFAAATWLRGVPLVNVPTTVLGMVDAALGGKTAVDLPEGKNLVGAFHQPTAVLADLDTLATLPAAEVSSGLAEVVKAGFIADPALVDACVAAAPAVADPAARAGALAPLVEAAVRIKAEVVAADEREAGSRALLNYGHTLGHALERLAGYRGLRHGEAVALGMVFAARVAEAVGLAAPGLAAGHVRALRALGLPTGGVTLDPAAVLAAMATDKKHRGGLRLVLLREPGHPTVVPAPAAGVLTAAVRSLAESGVS